MTSHHAIRILLVDDNDEIRRMVAKALRRAGYYNIYEASHAKEARRVFGENCPFDLLLTDVEMPGGDGDVLASELRSIQGSLPVIYMSGNPVKALEKPIVDRHVASGTARFLAKPLSLQELRQTIEELLGR